MMDNNGFRRKNPCLIPVLAKKATMLATLLLKAIITTLVFLQLVSSTFGGGSTTTTHPPTPTTTTTTNSGFVQYQHQNHHLHEYKHGHRSQNQYGIPMIGAVVAATPPTSSSSSQASVGTTDDHPRSSDNKKPRRDASSSLPRNPLSSSSSLLGRRGGGDSQSHLQQEDADDEEEEAPGSWWKDFDKDADTYSNEDGAGDGSSIVDGQDDGERLQLQIPCGLIISSIPNLASPSSSSAVNVNNGGSNNNKNKVLPLAKAIIDTSTARTLLHRRVVEETYPQLKLFVRQKQRQYQKEEKNEKRTSSNNDVDGSLQYYIPAGILSLRMDEITIPSPTLWIVTTEDDGDSSGGDDFGDGVDLWLGLDLLRQYDAVIDVQSEEVRLKLDDDIITSADDESPGGVRDEIKSNHSKKKEYIIPMIRPRRPLTLDLFSESSTEDEL